MMGRGTARKYVEFLDKNKFGKISASLLLLKRNSVLPYVLMAWRGTALPLYIIHEIYSGCGGIELLY
jgi:hypothetical protein